MGAHDFKLYNVPFFARKSLNFNVSRSAAPETSSCATNLLYVRCKAVKIEGLCQVSSGLKEVQIAAHVFKLKKVPFPTLKKSEYQCFKVC